jgi:hypothetical protein
VAPEAVTEAPLADEEEAEEVVVWRKRTWPRKRKRSRSRYETNRGGGGPGTFTGTVTDRYYSEEYGSFLLKTCRSYLRSEMLETPREVSALRLLLHRHLRITN